MQKYNKNAHTKMHFEYKMHLSRLECVFEILQILPALNIIHPV